MIEDYFNISFRNLKRRKLRSWLTMLGIFISVATIFTLVSLSLGLQIAVEEQFELLGSDKFFIQPKGQLGPPQGGASVELTKDDLEVVDRVQGIRRSTYFSVGNAEIEFGGKKRFSPVFGMPSDGLDFYFEIGALSFAEGKAFNSDGSREVIIGNHYKTRNLFGKPVESGDKFIINGEEFKVRGILEIIGNPDDDKMILTSGKDMEEVFGVGDRVDYMMLQLNEGEDMNEVVAKVEKKLRNFRDVDEKTQDFTVITPEELLAIFGTILSVITAFLLGIAMISLVVGGIGITNTMYTSVLERTKEIGVMKAIGAKNGDVLMIFLIESGLLGLVGGVVGIGLGFGISKSIEFMAAQELGTKLLQAAAPLWLIVGCLAFAFLTGAISGVMPAWRASKVIPVEALRYE
ncbi:hypothetical protein CMI46_00615 [Candidatus Pacearchaeota archaeon]|nr:hypothetical protein [Candidatus Pacearchaeota archaeon]